MSASRQTVKTAGSNCWPRDLVFDPCVIAREGMALASSSQAKKGKVESNLVHVGRKACKAHQPNLHGAKIGDGKKEGRQNTCMYKDIKGEVMRPEHIYVDQKLLLNHLTKQTGTS